ncbi:MAG: cupin domain-containing protein [bacterium]|nr:cupin domain-containing protein [bacterium]
MMSIVNIEEKLSQIDTFWEPAIAGELNNQYVKLAKFKGDFVWHQHENEDEMFLVVKGSLTVKLRDKNILLNEGEFYIIPKGVEHKPVAEEEVHVMLFEPNTAIPGLLSKYKLLHSPTSNFLGKK